MLVLAQKNTSILEHHYIQSTELTLHMFLYNPPMYFKNLDSPNSTQDTKKVGKRKPRIHYVSTSIQTHVVAPARVPARIERSAVISPKQMYVDKFSSSNSYNFVPISSDKYLRSQKIKRLLIYIFIVCMYKYMPFVDQPNFHGLILSTSP